LKDNNGKQAHDKNKGRGIKKSSHITTTTELQSTLTMVKTPSKLPQAEQNRNRGGKDAIYPIQIRIVAITG